MNMKRARLLIVASIALLALSQVARAGTVTVNAYRGNAFFGSPTDSNDLPLVVGISVTGPATITITATGCESDVNVGIAEYPANGCITPNGYPLVPSSISGQSPLQQAGLVSNAYGTWDYNFDGLIGAFVSAATVNNPKFIAENSTSSYLPAGDVGINPNQLFFIGDSLTYTATQAGTLFLGINDWITDDNGGSFDVTLNASTSVTPEPGTLTLVGLGGLAIARKLRQRGKRSV